MFDYNRIAGEFNEISEFYESNNWHNAYFYRRILKSLPRLRNSCLDIGCGQGELSFLLSWRFEEVIAIDFSEKMIDKALTLNNNNNIKYVCKNILDIAVGNNSFDLIVTVVTAHHFSLEWLLLFVRDKLKNGGRFILVDIANIGSAFDVLCWSTRFIQTAALKLFFHKTDLISVRAKEAWDRHGTHDKYLTIKEIKSAVKIYLPSAHVHRDAFSRYYLVWDKKQKQN